MKLAVFLQTATAFNAKHLRKNINDFHVRLPNGFHTEHQGKAVQICV